LKDVNNLLIELSYYHQSFSLPLLNISAESASFYLAAQKCEETSEGSRGIQRETDMRFRFGLWGELTDCKYTQEVVHRDNGFMQGGDPV
jgi:hypothetical protein